VICVGESELTEARRRLPHDRISYLPNGVDTGRFREGDGEAFRSKHGIHRDAFVVLNISRIDAQKNQLLLVDAFARLHATTPEAMLVLIGPETQPAYAAKLRERAGELGLRESVRILPGLRNDSADLPNAFHACDAFVLPSVHEPFGIVVLEAWSAGKAVIASAVGGLKMLVQDEQTGLLFNPNTLDAAELLAKKLRHLHLVPEFRAKLAIAGQREAGAQYDWSVISRRLENIYGAAEDHASQRYGGARR